ncbi:MAG: beta/gamma crystallin-related protein [Parvularculaceae bacterium]
MKKLTKFVLWAVGGSAATFAAAAALASESSEPSVLVMYENVGLSGRSVSYTGPVEDIDVRFPFLSGAVASGTWELCSRNDFRGACLIVDSDVPNIKKEMGFFARIRSVRPVSAAYARREAPPAVTVATPQPETGEPVAIAPTLAAEASLAGYGSQFFKDPKLNGNPIEAKDREAAEEFCAGAGFSAVEYRQDVSQGGRKVLGDLLCSGARN